MTFTAKCRLTITLFTNLFAEFIRRPFPINEQSFLNLLFFSQTGVGVLQRTPVPLHLGAFTYQRRLLLELSNARVGDVLEVGVNPVSKLARLF